MSTVAPNRSRRYPVTLMADVQRMAAIGWTAAEIRRILQRQGVDPPPDWTTIKVWTDPEYAERHNQHRTRGNRAKSASKTGRLGTSKHTPEFKLCRLRGLHAAGVGISTIATVMRFDYGDRLTRGQIEYALEHGRYPRRTTEKAAA